MFKINFLMKKTVGKFEIMIIILENIRELLMLYENHDMKIRTKFQLILHNRSNYDYHLIIKELAEEFEEHFVKKETWKNI